MQQGRENYEVLKVKLAAWSFADLELNDSKTKRPAEPGVERSRRGEA
jgi:hypothetical protein